ASSSLFNSAAPDAQHPGYPTPDSSMVDRSLVISFFSQLADLMLFHLSATSSIKSTLGIDEYSEREEEDAFFLSQSQPIGRSSRTSFS
nr:hypothetical protein [Tanacetum cinerariifolium]